MNFDDHEIWGAPVRSDDASPEAPIAGAVTEPSSASSGRLYRSIGSDPHPGAVVALPNQRRHNSASQEGSALAPAQAGQPPISINSRLPRIEVEDAAIAEVLATPVSKSASPIAGFTSWFKSKPQDAAALSPERHSLPVAGSTIEPSSLAQLSAWSSKSLNAPVFLFAVFAVTALVAIVNAVSGSTLGLPTGLALAFATAAAAWRIEAGARWAAWVMPSYALIAAILVGGQFTSSAPGGSMTGQILLIATGLITLAPWLAAATVLGIVVPAVRQRGR